MTPLIGQGEEEETQVWIMGGGVTIYIYRGAAVVTVASNSAMLSETKARQGFGFQGFLPCRSKPNSQEPSPSFGRVVAD